MKALLQFLAITFATGLPVHQVQAQKIDPDLPRISYIQYESFDIVTVITKIIIYKFYFEETRTA